MYIFILSSRGRQQELLLELALVRKWSLEFEVVSLDKVVNAVSRLKALSVYSILSG